MRVALDCGSCLIWKASFNTSFSVKSDISSCFFQKISFQTQAVLSNSSMFCFSDIDVSLCCCKSVCRLSVVVPEKFCSLLGSCRLFCVGGGSSSKQRLPRQGNITAVVFPKWLELSVTSHAHSALTSFGIGLACGSLLKPQKPC